MIRLFILIILVCSIDEAISQNQVIFSDSMAFEWNLFSSIDNNISQNGAEIKCGTEISIVKEYEDSLVLEVKTFMDTNSSWVDSRFKTKKALAHEFGHLKLLEIYNRILRCYFISNTFSYYNYEKSKNQLRKNVFDEYRLISNRYDRETDFHRNQEEQNKWNRAIDKALIQLSEYKDERLTIRMSIFEKDMGVNPNIFKSDCSSILEKCKILRM